jgi:hypothetical protein
VVFGTASLAFRSCPSPEDISIKKFLRTRSSAWCVSSPPFHRAVNADRLPSRISTSETFAPIPERTLWCSSIVTLDPSNTLRPCRALTYVEVTEDVDSGPREDRLAVAGGSPSRRSGAPLRMRTTPAGEHGLMCFFDGAPTRAGSIHFG